MDHTFFFRLPPGADARLRELSTEHLCTILVTLFAHFERHGYVDDDVLTAAGGEVATAGHPGIDHAALAWLEASPSEPRLAITSAFLSGYWPSASMIPDSHELGRLVAIARRFAPRDTGWRMSAGALLRTYQRARLAASTRNQLRRTLKEFRDALAGTDVHPPLEGLLTEALA